MSNKITKESIISSLFWKLLERGGAQCISFLVSIFLARLLSPSDYGLISLIIIFINIANVFVQGGFNTALIQKRDATTKEFTSVFYYSFFIASLLYILLFIIAPYIAEFYNEIILKGLIRVLSLTLFLGAINSVQVAFVSKNMEFKKLFVSNIGAIAISAITGIVMAIKGFGVWSLVGQQLSNQLFSVIIMFFTVSWKPKLEFSYKQMKSLISYGWKILFVNLTTTLFLNLRSLIIGKLYKPDMLGYFNRGRQFPEIIMTNINGSIQSVMLVAYSSEQDNRERIRNMVKRTMKVNAFLIFPIMFGLVATADPIVRLLLTDKWLPAVPFIQICSFMYMLMPIHTANLESIKAMGYSNIILKLDLMRKALELSVLLISIRYGIYAIALGEVITTVISLWINLYPNRKLINYGLCKQIKDISHSFLAAIIMAVIVYAISFLNIGLLMKLLIQIILGITIYFLLAKLMKIPELNYLYNLCKENIGLFKKNCVLKRVNDHV